MAKDNRSSIEEYVRNGAGELNKVIGQMTNGNTADRIKQGLQEIVTKDTAKKAGIFAGAGVGGSILAPFIPIAGPVLHIGVSILGGPIGVGIGAGLVYVAYKGKRAYDRATSEKYSKI